MQKRENEANIACRKLSVLEAVLEARRLGIGFSAKHILREHTPCTQAEKQHLLGKAFCLIMAGFPWKWSCGECGMSLIQEGKGSCSWKERCRDFFIPRAGETMPSHQALYCKWQFLPRGSCSLLAGLKRSASKAPVYIYREGRGCSWERIPCGCLRRYILATVPIHSNNMNWNEISATHLIQHISISNLYFVKNIESIIQSLQ